MMAMSVNIICDYSYCHCNLLKDAAKEPIEVYLTPDGEMRIRRFGGRSQVYCDADNAAESLTGQPRVLHYCCQDHWKYEIGEVIQQVLFPDTEKK